MRKLGRSLSENRLTAIVLSQLFIWYLTLVYKTNKIIVEPENALELVSERQPFIVGVWHGQHVLLPALPIGLRAAAMISRSLDGEVTARVVEHFGNQTIRASGGRNSKTVLKKGGMVGFLEMLRFMETGGNVVQTADIPRGVARRAGLGIVTLAQRSGNPVLPLAVASSRRYIFEKSWDRTTLNMPFGKTAICIGEMVNVPEDCNDEALEHHRQMLENELNRITHRAYELTGNPE